MVPDHKVFPQDFEGEYLLDKPLRYLSDISLGAISLQNASEGLDYQPWQLRVESDTLVLEALTTGEKHIISTGLKDVERVTLSFDFNMNYAYTYRIASVDFLVYYNSVINKYTTLELTDSRDACLVFDGNIGVSNSDSDILLVYIRLTDNMLVYRLLRDRYTVEQELYQLTPEDSLISVGMTTKYRLRFKIKTQEKT